jgi:hypothetical protein
MTNYQKADAAYRKAVLAHQEIKLALYAGRIGYDEYSASIRHCNKLADWCDAAECQGHPAPTAGVMGETVYCNGACRK